MKNQKSLGQSANAERLLKPRDDPMSFTGGWKTDRLPEAKRHCSEVKCAMSYEKFFVISCELSHNSR
jgi:hypothetical protein